MASTPDPSGVNDVPKSNDDEDSNKLTTVRTIGRFKMRGKTDDLPQDWWFASTAIPLLAATIGPLANVLSIAALVSKWRVKLQNEGQLPEGADDLGENIPDPTWELVLNAVSLGLGFFGNFFLLLNFTRRIRYIVALPVTIISWYLSTGILIAIIVAMNQYIPPIRPGETYSQGFWHAIIAATLYMIGSMILMVNMLGYFLGHYPQHFDLDDDQRTLILQTMMFFFWLAGGAAVFSKVCGFSYANALYFCDVTVLTIGFGDITAVNDAGRGLVFPYSVIGIIFLGLMIKSIRKFAAGMSKDKVIRKHQLNERQRTFGRTVTSERELRDRLGLPPRQNADRSRSQSRQPSSSKILEHRTSLDQYGHFQVRGRTIVFKEQKQAKAPGPLHAGGRGGAGRTHQALSRDAKMQRRASGQKAFQLSKRRERLILLKEERDRFNAMRDIQAHTSRFKQYYALSMSVFAFGILWCVGALVFMIAEERQQGLSYFQSLYFCYVSLLTIGYGDFSPKSNAGKPFFIIWSLVAIPTMTILISDMGDTVISAINRGTFTLADWTVMPKAGVWHDFLQEHPKLRDWLQRKTKEREEKKRVEKGFGLQNPEDLDLENVITAGEERQAEREEEAEGLDLEKAIATEALSDHDLARRLALAIRKTADDLRAAKPRKYDYEEWVEFTRLIRFSGRREDDLDDGEDVEEEGALEWDWIGEDSPMLADMSETEWVLDKLCESLNRYTRRQAREAKEAERTRLRHEEEQREIRESHFIITSPTFDIPPHLPHSHPPSPSHPPSSSSSKTHPHYPAHPGLRTPGTEMNYHHQLGRVGSGSDRTVSPVLSRGPSGVEIVKLNSKGKTVGGGKKGKDRDDAGGGGVGRSRSGSGSLGRRSRGVNTGGGGGGGEKVDAGKDEWVDE